MDNKELEDSLKVIRELAELLVRSHSANDGRRKIDVFIEAGNQISGALNEVDQKIDAIQAANSQLSKTVKDLANEISELKRMQKR